jgi:uncharacterized membrane protein
MAGGTTIPEQLETAGGASSWQTGRDNVIEGSNLSIGQVETLMSAFGGGALVIAGLVRRGWSGVTMALVGGSMLYCAATGRSLIPKASSRSSTSDEEHSERIKPSIRHGQGIKVEKSITINRSAEDLYRYWSAFENLPRFMTHLKAVHAIGDNRWFWIAKAPLGMVAEWEAEVYNRKENELIAWRSLEGSEIPNAGSVRFEREPNGRGTIVKVSVSYAPPGGTLGATVARLFGENPDKQIEDDLHRFKELMEVGQHTSTDGWARDVTAGL